MKLSEYMKSLGAFERERLAQAAGTTAGHLRNVAFSGKPCGFALAVGIEAASGAVVRRWDLRPDDWHLIWPELIGAEGAPAVPQMEARDAA